MNMTQVDALIDSREATEAALADVSGEILCECKKGIRGFLLGGGEFLPMEDIECVVLPGDLVAIKPGHNRPPVFILAISELKIHTTSKSWLIGDLFDPGNGEIHSEWSWEWGNLGHTKFAVIGSIGA